MYFHVIWIKDLNGTQQNLDFLLDGNDFSAIKVFCENFGIVVVSIQQYDEPTAQFWDILLRLKLADQTREIIIKGTNLEETARLFLEMDFPVVLVNSLTNPIPENLSEKLLSKILGEVAQQKWKIEEEAFEKRNQEIKKYEDKNVFVAIDLIEKNIQRIEQLLAIGREILPYQDIKQLEGHLSELKKLKLWNNFHKMSNTLDAVETLLMQNEDFVLKELDNKKTMIDNNSCISSFDVIREYNTLLQSLEKNTLNRQLSIKEQCYALFRTPLIYLKFLGRDIFASENSFSSFMDQFWGMGEFFLIALTVVLGIYSFEPWIFHNNLGCIWYLPFLWVMMLFLCLYKGIRGWFSSHGVRFFVLLCSIAGSVVSIWILKNYFAL